MTKLIANTSKMRGILRRLRPPCSRPLQLIFGFTYAQRINPGYTLVFPAGEDVLAPGDGRIVAVGPLLPFWAFSTGSEYATATTVQVVIEHGSGLKTVVHGLSTASVRVGQQVTRGDVIGTPQTQEVFFAVLYNGQPYDPSSINRHFQPEDGKFVVGQGGYLRFAPDFSLRDFAEGLYQTLVGGWHYFYNQVCARASLLINIAFNGNGSKVGPAVAGVIPADYWNNYDPVGFGPLVITGGYYYNCLNYTTTVDPVVFLLDYAQANSTIWLERQSMVADKGTSAWFDPMLSRWAGAYSGGTPLENTFSLRGVPAGNYVLYLYANQGTPPDISTFYVSVDDGAPTVKSNTPTGTAAFVENANYVKFNLSLGAESIIHIKVYGFIAGLQLFRT
jgi:hypothetical protein